MMLTRRYITVLSLGVLVLLVGFMLWTATAQPAPLTITGQLGACDPSNSIANYEYQVVTLETGGDYTFTRVSADSSDIQMWLYIDSFTPTNPSSNVYAADITSQTITLQPQNAPQSFVIVMYVLNASDATGNWSASITSSSGGSRASLGANSITTDCVETTPEATSEVTPEVTQPIIPVPEIMVTAAPDCPVVPPADAVQGRMLVTAQAYFAPDETKESPGILIPAGTAWWIMDASNGFYKLFIACKAELVWVKSSTMGANYDEVWGGAPLPN